MNRGLTELSEISAKSILDVDKTREIIRQGFPIRTTAEELGKLIKNVSKATKLPVEVLEKRIKTAVGATSFRNWIDGRNTISRQSAIKICFALKLSSTEAARFITNGCWHDGFYMRDYKDLIYVFFLDSGLEYKDAESLIDKHRTLDTQNPDIETPMPLGGRITEILERQYKSTVRTVEDLEAFLEKNSSLFGSFRRKANEKFTNMYGMLKNMSEMDAPTDDEICRMVLMNIPSLKAFGGITNEILVKIAENTLPRSGLSAIINKTADSKTGKIPEVGRKHLILIWLLLYGGRPDFEDSYGPDVAFEESVDIINYDMLEPCGMPTLDPRNPFDWLVINALFYCHLAQDDEDADAVERIRIIIAALFNGETEA